MEMVLFVEIWIGVKDTKIRVQKGRFTVKSEDAKAQTEVIP